MALAGPSGFPAALPRRLRLRLRWLRRDRGREGAGLGLDGFDVEAARLRPVDFDVERARLRGDDLDVERARLRRNDGRRTTVRDLGEVAVVERDDDAVGELRAREPGKKRGGAE